jgi:hypothetical protein
VGRHQRHTEPSKEPQGTIALVDSDLAATCKPFFLVLGIDRVMNPVARTTEESTPSTPAARAEGLPTLRTILRVGLVVAWCAIGPSGCRDCPLTAKMAPTVTQEALLALRVGMPEAQVHALLGKPVAGGRTTVPGRPHRWYYAMPACTSGDGWMVQVQILNDRLHGVSVSDSGEGAFHCFEGDCPPVDNVEVFRRLPAGRGGPNGRPVDLGSE